MLILIAFNDRLVVVMVVSGRKVQAEVILVRVIGVIRRSRGGEDVQRGDRAVEEGRVNNRRSVWLRRRYFSAIVEG